MSGSAELLHGYDDFRAYCNPILALRAELSAEPFRLVAVKDDGALVDRSGALVHDFLAGWGTQAFGHRNPSIARALTAFLEGDAPSFFTSGVSPLAGTLARRLCERTGHGAAFFASGGTEAVEAALKLARAATKRPRILCLEGAFHGCTMGSLAMMDKGLYRDPFGPHLPAVEALPWDDVAALSAALATGDVAAVVLEPIQAERGVRQPSPEYLAALGELTTAHGTLLVADEVLTGMGRTGTFLASETWPRRPDVVVMGKALGGGLVPVSCVMTSRVIYDRAFGTHTSAESHGSTFSGNGLAMVAALAALDLCDEALCARVAAAGEAFRAALVEALADLPLVEEVRGRGLLVGVRLRDPDHPWFSFASLGLEELGERPVTGMMLCHRLYRAGYLVQVGGHDWSTLRIHPPLTTSDERLAAFVHACAKEVRFLCGLL